MRTSTSLPLSDAPNLQGAIGYRALLDGAALADVVGGGKADLRSLAEFRRAALRGSSDAIQDEEVEDEEQRRQCSPWCR